jgi:hypothetical protein
VVWCVVRGVVYLGLLHEKDINNNSNNSKESKENTY